MLLFGYDTEKEIVYVKGYNHVLRFTTYVISFDELKRAFSYSKEETYCDTKDYPIELIKIKEMENNPVFSLSKYTKQLRQYLCSSNDKTEFLQPGRSINELESFGVNAYKDFEEYIEIAMKHAYRVPYRVVYRVAHIWNRITYVCNKGSVICMADTSAFYDRNK